MSDDKFADVAYVAYGLRRDGTIGVESKWNPVLSKVGFNADTLKPNEFLWSNGEVTRRWNRAPTFQIRGGYLISDEA